VEQIHVRAGIGHPQHPVDVDRLDVGVHLEPLGRHHLKCFAALDFTDEVLDDRSVLLDGALRAVPRLWSGECGNCRWQRLTQRGGHHVDRVVVGLIDPLLGAIPVHRIGDQRDGALVVIDGRHVGGQQQQHVGQIEVVDGQLGQPFQPPHQVVGKEAHHAAG
jgi:hypothetical protein